MGFNNLQPASGPFSLAAGFPMRIWVWGAGGGRGQAAGADQGAQWIMADPASAEDGRYPSGEFPKRLMVSDFTKVRDLWVDTDPQSGLITIDFTKTVVRYEVTVTNIGTGTVHFSVQGGGNS